MKNTTGEAPKCGQQPREAPARRLISAWNRGSGLAFGYNFREYPDTPEFISELAQLISAARNSEEPQIVEDGVGDSLCLVCRRQRC